MSTDFSTMTFEELESLEQDVWNNSHGFRAFLDEKKITYKQNGHQTTIIGNHDLFSLGVAYGRFWESHEKKGNS